MAAPCTPQDIFHVDSRLHKIMISLSHPCTCAHLRRCLWILIFVSRIFASRRLLLQFASGSGKNGGPRRPRQTCAFPHRPVWIYYSPMNHTELFLPAHHQPAFTLNRPRCVPKKKSSLTNTQTCYRAAKQRQSAKSFHIVTTSGSACSSKRWVLKSCATRWQDCATEVLPISGRVLRRRGR